MVNSTVFPAHLSSFKQIDEYTWALRFSAQDSQLFQEIKDVIKSFHKRYRRWDPDECDERGAWIVDELVLDELEPYFPTMHRQRFPDEKGKEEDPYSCPF